MESKIRVVNTPETEAKRLFLHVRDLEIKLLYNFFNDNVTPPHGVTEDEYLRKLIKEYHKLYKERAKLLRE